MKAVKKQKFYIFSLIFSLVEGRVRVEFPLTDSKAVRQEEINSNAAASAALLFDSAATKQLKDIGDKCKNDLLEICNTIASEKKITVSSLINMQAIMAMAEKLPVSEEEMLNIPHVTKANYEKVCKRLLTVTQHYAAMRMAIMIDVEEQQQQQQGNNSDTDGTDWGQLARSSNNDTPSRGGSGTKRKRGWNTGSSSGGGSQRRTGGRKTTRARATPKKRGGSRYKRGRGSASGTPARVPPGTVTSRAPKLMPVPGPSTNRW